MALIISTWFWGTKYSPSYVRRLRASVARNLNEPFRWDVFCPQAADQHLTQMPGCLARLRMFDPDWQLRNGIEAGDRLVCMDLDSIITGPLDGLFDRPEDFVILAGANAANPCPFNGSLMMLRAGTHSEVWSKFSLDALKRTPKHDFHDDQGWIAHMLPNAGTWRAGEQSGVVAFQKPGWPRGDVLPTWARLVAFPGHRDPSKFTHLPWVQEHWRE